MIDYTDPRRCLCVGETGSRCVLAAITEDGLCSCCAASTRDLDTFAHAYMLPFGTVTSGVWVKDDVQVVSDG